jgi:uncharacterized membrane protein
LRTVSNCFVNIPADIMVRLMDSDGAQIRLVVKSFVQVLFAVVMIKLEGFKIKILVMKVEQSIEINKPADEVFGFLLDIDNHTKFGTAFYETKKISEGPVAIGTKIKRKGRFMGKELETTHEVASFVPAKVLAFKTIGAALEAQDSFVLEDKNGKTVVTQIIEAKPTGMMKLAAGIIKSKIADQMHNDLNLLKSLLEN